MPYKLIYMFYTFNKYLKLFITILVFKIVSILIKKIQYLIFTTSVFLIFQGQCNYV